MYPDPELRNGDVWLSPWRETDASALVDAWADPQIQLGCAVPPDGQRELANAERWIAGQDQRTAARSSIDLVVRSSEGEVTGEVGLGPFDWNRPAALLGFWTACDWRGQGRAQQSCALVCDWAMSEFGLVAILAETSSDNLGSQRVLESLGFTLLNQPTPDRQVWVLARSD